MECELAGFRLSLTEPFVDIEDAERVMELTSPNSSTSFLCLVFIGCLQEVLVGEKFKFEKDIETIAGATGHQLGEYDYEKRPLYLEHGGRQSWRKVFISTRPGLVAGWGSFEDPEFPIDGSFSGGEPIHAFHVSTTFGLLAGFGVGNLNVCGLNCAYKVILLRRLQGCQYERIGVGAIFGREAERGWSRSEDQDLELV